PRPRPRGGGSGAPGGTRLVVVRHAQRDRDLILLAVERGQRRVVVTDLRPDDRIRPRTDVQRRGAAPELLPRVRGEAIDPAGAGAVLVVHVVAAQRQAEGRAEVVGDPGPSRPPLGVLCRNREGGVGLLLVGVART